MDLLLDGKTGLKLIAIFMVVVLISLLKYIFYYAFTYIIGPLTIKVDYTSKGKWALITGCTDGIGKEYARQLAKKGCDIILVSRSMDKLKATASEIEKDFKVNTKIIQVDFCDNESIYEKISKEIEGLEIGTLVNNVGISYPYPEYFLDIPDREQCFSNIIQANIVAVTRMTSLILPAMVQRGKGVIINIGSGSATIPCPLLAVYAASKAYMEKFSESLDIEYSKKGIIIQYVYPGFVCSKMSGIRESSIFTPSPYKFVESAMKFVGVTSRTTGYVPHTFAFFLIKSLCNISKRFTNWLIVRTMENTRRKALKKYKSN